MPYEETLLDKLIELLAGIEFGRRYYAYYDAHRSAEDRGMLNAGREELEAALAATSLKFKYDRREKFFHHERVHEHCTVGLKVAFPHSAVELILSLKTRFGDIGDSFPGLAMDSEKLRDPDFDHTPPYPYLPFSSLAELRDAVQFGVSLFEDAERAILTYDGWDAP